MWSFSRDELVRMAGALREYAERYDDEIARKLHEDFLSALLEDEE